MLIIRHGVGYELNWNFNFIQSCIIHIFFIDFIVVSRKLGKQFKSLQKEKTAGEDGLVAKMISRLMCFINGSSYKMTMREQH